MEEYHGKPVEYWKENAEENYKTTPISVLKYITVLEAQAEELRKDCDRCKKLEFMIDNGLGWKDMVNENKPAN